jgi:hypothetical protein
MGTPRDEYLRRLEVARLDRQRLTGREYAVRVAQVATVLLGVVPLLMALPQVQVAWLLLPAILFAALLAWQRRLRRGLRRANRLIEYYERGLARLDGNWLEVGNPGTELTPPDHAYALDLDLFGRGSLFHRLSTTRTDAGARMLAGWLLAPATPVEVRRRHEAVHELRGRLDLREELYLLAADVPAGTDTQPLVRWGAEPPLLPARVGETGILALLLFGYAVAAAAIAGHITFVPLKLLALAPVVCFVYFSRRVGRVVGPIQRYWHDLTLFRGLLLCIEREAFRSAALLDLQEGMKVDGQPPSRCLRRLERQVGRLQLMNDPMTRWVGWMEMRTTRVAFALEAWRAVHGRAIARWLDAVAVFEALSSLAAYAFENPDDSFPELDEAGPCFEAKALTHPLLPPARGVANDVRLGRERRGLIVTGSNMSGKSTLLRAVGVNAVLALAGAPVRATRLRLSPLAVGASIRVLDSLLAGQSRFLAEIRRLRQMVDLTAGSLPLLFLIDEMLHGTNPADRQKGSEAVVLELLARGAIGLVTTHDLALTVLAERPGIRLENVHFIDHLENGELRFDYRMQPGVIPRSNAVALMRAIGLSIPEA